MKPKYRVGILLMILIGVAYGTLLIQGGTKSSADHRCHLGAHKYLGNYPSERQNGWSHELNGVAHDSNNWFFTQNKKLWKFPVSHDLNKKVTKPDPSQGIRQVGIPLEGYNHFGDLDHYDGYLFVPLTGGSERPPRIAVFRSSNLRYVGSAAVPLQGLGWVAIHPTSRFSDKVLLYTSDKHVTPDQPIRTYTVDLARLNQGQVRIEPHGSLRAYDESGNELTLRHMQGGTFSDDGCYIYLVNGYAEDFDPDKGGVMVFNVATGKRVARSTNGHGDFNYEFHPGWSKYEEPEGITFWNLNDGRAPGIRGQLHVIMLDNDHNADDFYFKHYDIER